MTTPEGDTMHLPTQHLDTALPLPAYARDDDAGADLRSTTTVLSLIHI